MLKVADTSVNHFERVGRGLLNEISSLHEADVQSTNGALQGEAGSVDPAPDHEDVELFVMKAREVALQRGMSG